MANKKRNNPRYKVGQEVYYEDHHNKLYLAMIEKIFFKNGDFVYFLNPEVSGLRIDKFFLNEEDIYVEYKNGKK